MQMAKKRPCSLLGLRASQKVKPALPSYNLTYVICYSDGPFSHHFIFLVACTRLCKLVGPSVTRSDRESNGRQTCKTASANPHVTMFCITIGSFSLLQWSFSFAITKSSRFLVLHPEGLEYLQRFFTSLRG